MAATEKAEPAAEGRSNVSLDHHSVAVAKDDAPADSEETKPASSESAYLVSERKRKPSICCDLI